MEQILTGGRTFGKSWQRDQGLKGQPLNSKIKMIYAHTSYAPEAKPAHALTLTERHEIVRSYLHLHSVKTREIHGKLYAYDEHWNTVKQVHGEWVNAITWTLQDTRDFLGY